MRFVNFLKFEEERNQIVLIVDRATAGKAEAFSEPEHRLETSDGSPRRIERLEAANPWHVLLYLEMVTVDALLEMLGDIVDRGWMKTRHDLAVEPLKMSV